MICIFRRLGRQADLCALGSDIQAIKPYKGGLYFFGLKSCRSELAAELLKFGASVTLPVILVDVHQYFKHVPNITQMQVTVSSAFFGAEGAAALTGCQTLEQAAGQARKLPIKLEFQQPRLQPSRIKTGSGLQ